MSNIAALPAGNSYYFDGIISFPPNICLICCYKDLIPPVSGACNRLFVGSANDAHPPRHQEITNPGPVYYNRMFPGMFQLAAQIEYVVAGIAAPASGWVPV